jgi:hypothetical protein
MGIAGVVQHQAPARPQHLRHVEQRLRDVEDVVEGASIEDEVKLALVFFRQWKIEIMDDFGAFVVRDIERHHLAIRKTVKNRGVGDAVGIFG